MTEILLVEDDARLRAAMARALEEGGYAVTAAGSLAEAEARLGAAGPPPDVMVLDVRLHEDSGVGLVRTLAAAGRLPSTVVVSGAATIAETVEALRLGVFDFIEKPASRERLLQSVANALEQRRLRHQVRELERRLESGRELHGASAAMRALRDEADRVAATEARVLVVGESGTGKELVAERIHRHSRRAAEPFVKLNCAAIPAPLVEAELFGHARGAFTDARTARAGLFEEADRGTLFLDEIGDMDAAVQARLLRVLEDGRVRRLGESQERSVDVRVISATHRDLDLEVEQGRFRADLYFRLAHVPIRVPPLRERRSDVRELFAHFVTEASVRHRLRPKQVADDVFPALQAYDWPGNVRELRNLCERLVVLGSDPLTAGQLPAGLRGPGRAAEVGWLRPARLAQAPLVPFRRFKAESEREYLEAMLQRHGGNLAATARALGLQRTYLHAKVVALGISRKERGGAGEGSG